MIRLPRRSTATATLFPDTTRFRYLVCSELAVDILRLFIGASIVYQEESGQRSFSMAHLPYWDKAAMNAEARRCIDRGLKGFVLPDKPEMFGIPGYMTGHWDEIGRAAGRERGGQYV